LTERGDSPCAIAAERVNCLTAIEATRSYDLVHVEVEHYRRMRSTTRRLQAILGGMLAMGAIGFAFIVPELVRYGPTVAGTLNGAWVFTLLAAIVFYLGIVALLLVQSARHGGRGPTRLNVLPDGFNLEWADGSRRTWNWRSFRGTLRLAEIHDVRIGAEAQIQLTIAGFGVLTREACAAIVESAESHGLWVKVQTSVPSARVSGSTSYTIRPRS